MKRIALTLLMLLCATTALADGPDAYTLTGTTSGVVWTAQDTGTVAPRYMVAYVSCIDDSFTAKVEHYVDGAWVVVRFGTGMSSPSDEIAIWANMIVPILGKYHRITFTTDTGDAEISIMAYTE